MLSTSTRFLLGQPPASMLLATCPIIHRRVLALLVGRRCIPFSTLRIPPRSPHADVHSTLRARSQRPIGRHFHAKLALRRHANLLVAKGDDPDRLNCPAPAAGAREGVCDRERCGVIDASGLAAQPRASRSRSALGGLGFAQVGRSSGRGPVGGPAGKADSAADYSSDYDGCRVHATASVAALVRKVVVVFEYPVVVSDSGFLVDASRSAFGSFWIRYHVLATLEDQVSGISCQGFCGASKATYPPGQSG